MLPWPDSKPWGCSTAKHCDDKLSCTKDVCSSKTHTCANTLLAGNCKIAGKCYKSGQTNPTNYCQRCIPGTSTKMWTTSANGSPCTTDKIHCTVDACKSGKCTHTLNSGWCRIGGVCHHPGKVNTANSCQSCDAKLSTSAWSSRPNGTGCTPDAYPCTSDVCSAGKCSHPQAWGCLINKVCMPEGEINPKDPCYECISKQSKTGYTYITGKPCGYGSGLAPICVAQKCKGWHESAYTPSWASTANTSFAAVDYLPAAKSVWAAGGYSKGTTVSGGILLQLGKPLPAIQKATDGFYDISYGMAVGRLGQVYHYSAGTWNKLALPAGSIDRYAVWGATINKKETFLLSGQETTTKAGVYACTVSGTAMTCTTHSGFTTNTVLGPIWGTVAGTFLGPSWVLEINATGNEDIYHSSSSTKWSAGAPQGCVDQGASGTTPCSKTKSPFSGLHGSSASDVWAVGAGGKILRYDGAKWAAVTNALTGQSGFTMDAVFSSAKDGLVIIAMHSNSITGNRVMLLTYNRALGRWFGPMEVRPAHNANTTDKIRGIGGIDSSNLWMVGQHKVLTSGTTYQIKGWILQLK